VLAIVVTSDVVTAIAGSTVLFVWALVDGVRALRRRRGGGNVWDWVGVGPPLPRRWANLRREASRKLDALPLTSMRDRPVTVAVACGLVAVALGSATMIPALRAANWSLSALPQVDSRTRLGAVARRVDPGFHTVHPGYDGQFYWGIAVDPVATGDVHGLLDKPSYRYGHPLYGWLGWLLSAGQPALVPVALAAVTLAAVFAAAAAASALGIRRGSTGWEGLCVALSPGLIFAAASDLGEPLAAALMLAAIAAVIWARTLCAWICLALLPLAKEPLALVLAAIVAWELLQQRPRRAALFAAALLPSLAWWTYARVQLGAWFTSGDTALGLPLRGWGHALLERRGGAADRAAATVALVLVVALIMVMLDQARRLRGPIDLACIALAIVAICLAANATAAISTALRNTSLLFALAPFVIASPPLVPLPRGLTSR
jgi:hypothetical protein